VEFDAQQGFIKGFIDLVFTHDGRFYLLDWKSNWLGASTEVYHADAVRAEMVRHHYVLQYHLYIVALHRHLARRLPGYDYARHFGGVFYLFLRGVDPARPELGVYRDRPEPEFIEELDALFARGGRP
jgi:exodeoxyribonuclease V beta subunit